MKGLRDMLMKEQTRLEKIIKYADESLHSAPDGYLRISKDKGRLRYYHCTDDNHGRYISKKNDLFPRILAQKSYDADILHVAQRRLKQIEKILYDYSDDEIERVYMELSSDRQVLVNPVEATYKQRIEKWYNQSYNGKTFNQGFPEIMSEKGERVRSKSEKIIADWLFRNNIKYLYEKPLNLDGYGTVYPDFTFLSPKNGKEIYWEHEGMMDNPEYAKPAVKKIELYEKNGIFPGENLILTFETSSTMINTDLVKVITTKYLV